MTLSIKAVFDALSLQDPRRQEDLKNSIRYFCQAHPRCANVGNEETDHNDVHGHRGKDLADELADNYLQNTDVRGVIGRRARDEDHQYVSMIMRKQWKYYADNRRRRGRRRTMTVEATSVDSRSRKRQRSEESTFSPSPTRSSPSNDPCSIPENLCSPVMPEYPVRTRPQRTSHRPLRLINSVETSGFTGSTLASPPVSHRVRANQSTTGGEPLSELPYVTPPPKHARASSPKGKERAVDRSHVTGAGTGQIFRVDVFGRKRNFRPEELVEGVQDCFHYLKHSQSALEYMSTGELEEDRKLTRLWSKQTQNATKYLMVSELDRCDGRGEGARCGVYGLHTWTGFSVNGACHSELNERTLQQLLRECLSRDPKGTTPDTFREYHCKSRILWRSSHFKTASHMPRRSKYPSRST